MDRRPSYCSCPVIGTATTPSRYRSAVPRLIPRSIRYSAARGRLDWYWLVASSKAVFEEALSGSKVPSFFELQEFDGVAALSAGMAIPEALAEIEGCASVAVIVDRTLNSLLAGSTGVEPNFVVIQHQLKVRH